MRFYPTLTAAAQEELPGLSPYEYDLEGLAAEVFTLDPVSGQYTHTGNGLTDEMMERHAHR